MKIAFLAPPVPGHLHPMTALARRLRSRGHDAVFIAVADGEPLVRAADIPFIPYCTERYPAGKLVEILQQLSKLKGQEGLEFSIGALARSLDAAFDDLPRALRENGIDAVVLDEVLWGLGLVPMHMGIPYAHVSNAMHFDYSGDAPLCVFGWPHETTPEAMARNREGLIQFAQMNAARVEVTHSYAEKVGLQIDWNDPFATISKLAWLSQTPKEFDFKENGLPSQFHYTGPFHDGSGRMEMDFPWDRLTGEPLIYASMGTLQNGLEYVFNTIAEAVGDRPGTQLVLSIGPGLNPEQIQPLPANALVVQRAPQLWLLKRSVLCITHAGLNTTLESLTQGVPMVAIPVTNDQPGVAARIAYTKTGTVLPLQELTVARLRPQVDEVLSNPEHRENAQRLKQAIGKEDGLEKAADMLEEVFSAAPAEVVVKGAERTHP
jgi:zeaxanthin glucosyltransferase